MKELIELVLVRGQPHVMNSTTEAYLANRVNCRKPKERKGPSLRKSVKVTPEMHRQFQLMRGMGQTWEAIGKHFGISETTVRRHLNGRR